MEGIGAARVLRVRCLILAIALACLLPLAAAPPSLAAEDRAQLRAMISDSRTDLRATAAALDGLTKVDRRVVRPQIERLRADATKASDALSAARGQAELARVGSQVRRLSSRSKGLLEATLSGSQALSDLAVTRQRAADLLASWLSGSLLTADYLRAQSQWALAGAHATRDHERALAAIRTLTPPPASTAPEAIRLARAGKTPAAVPGMTPVPGGCALPDADPATYLGRAREPGLHLWTSDAQVAAARARLQSPSPTLASAQKRVVALASELAKQPADPTSGGDLTTRALRIGYAWLSTQRPEFAAAMRADVAAVSRSGVPVQDLPDEAKIALATATNVDWLSPGADPSLAQELRRAREVILVRSLGQISCAIALKEDVLYAYLNKAVVVAGSATTAALAVAAEHPAAAAALVAAAVRMGKGGLAALAADGGTPEGPTYWNFQTVPLAGMLSSLDSVLGGRALPGVPDFRRTGVFAFLAPSTGGQVTRYSDTDTGELRCTLPAWIAGRWGGAEATAVALAGRIRLGVELLWWPTETTTPATQTSQVFPSTGLAVVHAGSVTAWLKGQAPLTAHTQLDAGTVGLSLGDVEFTMDPGYGPKIDYPGYSDNAPGGRRWTYAQTQPRWHSTVRVGPGLGQTVGATAAVAGGASSASVDLSSVLPGVSRASRAVEVTTQGMTVRDVMSASKAQEFHWGWMTDAQVTISGSSATLSKGGRVVTITWSGLPPGSSVSIVEVPSDLRYLTGSRTVLLSVNIPPTKSLDVSAHVAWS